jgi:hypothetical protein
MINEVILANKKKIYTLLVTNHVDILADSIKTKELRLVSQDSD